jgi:tetratricopeptide (TPR) repeat protein
MAREGSLKVVSGGDLKNYYGLAPHHIDAIAGLGFHLYRQGKLKEAETVFYGLIALDEQSFYGHAGLGTVALSQRNPDLQSACRHLERAAKINPQDVNVQANLGEALLRSARFQEAAQTFERCLALDPKLVQAGSRRARMIIQTIGAISDQVAAITPQSSANSPGRS